MTFVHDGSNSYIDNITGNLIISNGADDADILFKCDDGSGGNKTYFFLDGSIADGTFAYTVFPDSSMIVMGTSSDMIIGHNGTNSSVINYTGNLEIGNNANDKDVILSTDDGSGGKTAYVTLDGSITKTVFNKPSQRTFEFSSTTDGDANGDIVYFGGTTSMTVGTIYHYKSDGTWEVANPNAAATSDGLLAVALGAASDTNGMLLRGMVTLDHDPGAVGDVLFLSAASTGDATATAPAGNGDIVRVIGYQVGHASNGLIWFNPDGTFVEVTA